MTYPMKLLVNAIPMVNVSTGIGRYLRCLYAEMERSFGDRLEIGYFDGFKVTKKMPGGPANLGRWTKGVDFFWKMPVCAALAARLAIQMMREAIFWERSRDFDVYHEAGFFPFVGSQRLKTVFTIHDLSLIRFPQHHPRERIRYTRLFLRRRCARADHFLAVSQFTAREMRTVLGIAPERTTVTLEAHDPKIFYPRSREAIRDFLRDHALPETYFLFAGAGDPRKNMDVIPKALERGGLNAPLVVAGWSGWSEGLASKRVVTLGFVSDEDLARAYSGAIGMIFPSSYEGFGLPLLEAMACGCPVVTTRESSLPEVAGDAALYMKGPRDVNDLARILRNLVDGHVSREDLVRKGLIRAGEFSWEKAARQTVEAFEAVLT